MTLNPTPPITLRSATRDDIDHLFTIHQAASIDIVVATWGEWDEDWQIEYFRKQFDPAIRQVICYDDKDVGFLDVLFQPDEFFLQNIVIDPAFQGRGIGTELIGQILIKAEDAVMPVKLWVLKVNSGARNLYERLGFILRGETDTHYQMEFYRRKQ